MYNYKIITEMPKSWANKPGISIIIVHFYIRRKLDII